MSHNFEKIGNLLYSKRIMFSNRISTGIEENIVHFQKIEDVLITSENSGVIYMMSPCQGYNIVDLDRVKDEEYQNLNYGNLTIRKTPEKCDAIITSCNKSLIAFPADCLILGIVDKTTNTKALIHAGWRNLIGGVIEKTISRLVKRGIETKNLEVYISPGLGKESAEFDSKTIIEFNNALSYLNLNLDNFVLKQDTRYLVDLTFICEEILRKYPLKSLQSSRIDTYSAKEGDDFLFASYRRDRDGKRNAAIML